MQRSSTCGGSSTRCGVSGLAHVGSPVHARLGACLGIEPGGEAHFVHAGDAQFVLLLDLALVDGRAAGQRFVVAQVLVAQLGREQCVAGAALVRVPMGLVTELEDDAAFAVRRIEAADVVRIVAEQRLGNGQAAVHGRGELR